MQYFKTLAYLGACYALISHFWLDYHISKERWIVKGLPLCGACTLYTSALLGYPTLARMIQERIDKMARQKNIKYLMKQELNKMEAYGRSKHTDQIKTKEERTSLKAKGVPFEEYRTIDYTRNYIYSHNTMNTYQREADRFAEYLKDHNNHKITMEQAQEHVQEYLDYLYEEKHLSTQSIHTACAALSKIFHTTMWEYTKEERSVAKLERGNHTFNGLSKEQQIKQLQAYPIWKANRILGMRRNELVNLRSYMINEIGNRVEIEYIGKGGKHNRQIFTNPQEKEYILSLKQGKQEQAHIFAKKEINATPNLHKARELRCKDLYERITEDISKRGEIAEKEYITQIEHSFDEAHKLLKEDLKKPYYVRSANRQRLLEAHRPIKYNRIALMIISTQITQHFRSNVTANFYVSK